MVLLITVVVLFWTIRSLENQVESLEWNVSIVKEFKDKKKELDIQSLEDMERLGLYVIAQIPVQIQESYTRENEIIYPITIIGSDGTVFPLFKMTETEHNREALLMEGSRTRMILIKEATDHETVRKDVIEVGEH